MKKIGYICSANPFVDRTAWSGTIYKLREAIESAGFEVIWIPYNPLYKIDSWKSKLYNYYWNKRKKILHKNVLENIHTKFHAQRYAQSIDLKKADECDYLFFPGGAQISLFLKTNRPIIYLADATIHQMIDYYYFNIDNVACRIAKSLEKKASQKATINIRSSKWALDSVMNELQCDKNKCFVIEFGANIDIEDISPNPVYEGGRLNILFSGVDWKRKGLDVAVETVGLLRTKGLDAYLLIAGVKKLPQQCDGIDYIEFWGFLDKNDPEEYEKYIQLYKTSHLFLLPSKAECSAIVYSESAAYGIPCYTYDTGGVTNYVISDYNGYAFLPGSTSHDFADRIYLDIKQGRMKEYHDNALTLYKNVLSWNAWAIRFKEIMSNY